MIEKSGTILKEAVPFFRNPLGIFALVVVFTFPVTVHYTLNAARLDKYQLWFTLIMILAFLPMLFVGLLYCVKNHHTKLYGPGDFNNQKDFSDLAVQFSTSTVNKSEKYIQNAEIKGIKEGITGAKNEAVKFAESISRIIEDKIQKAVLEGNQGGQELLWVDDNPGNNFWEMLAFSAIGISITTARSTQEAIDILDQRTFAAIISDMGRAEGQREGYALLEAVQNRGIEAPFFIYSSSNQQEHLKEAKDKGASATNNAQILYQMVVEKLWK